MKTRSTPAATPGNVCGRYTRRNAVAGWAPSETAARMKDGGIVFMVATIGRIMKGRSTCVMAMTTPRPVEDQPHRRIDQTDAHQHRVTIPWSCRSTIQAAERTSSDVQSGSRTRIIRRLPLRWLALAFR